MGFWGRERKKPNEGVYSQTAYLWTQLPRTSEQNQSISRGKIRTTVPRNIAKALGFKGPRREREIELSAQINHRDKNAQGWIYIAVDNYRGLFLISSTKTEGKSTSREVRFYKNQGEGEIRETFLTGRVEKEALREAFYLGELFRKREGGS